MLKKFILAILFANVLIGNPHGFAMIREEDSEERPLQFAVARVKQIEILTNFDNKPYFEQNGRKFKMINDHLPYPFHHLDGVDDIIVKGIWNKKDKKWKFSQTLDLGSVDIYKWK